MNPSHSARGRAAAAAVAIVLAGGSALAGVTLGERRREHTPPPTGSTPQLTAPSISSTDDDASAVDVAVRYVATTGELLSRSPVGRREILRHLVAPDAVDAQAAALDATAQAMSDKLGHPVEQYEWIEAPLTATLEPSSDPDTVMVSVWTVSVFASAESATVEQIWRTVHVTLTRTRTGWLVTTAATDVGPVPTPNELALPTSVAEFLTVARWAPVVAHESL